MSLGVEGEATVHSSPEDYETLKDMEMTVSETNPLYDDVVLVAKEKREIREDTLWVIETTFVAVGVSVKVRDRCPLLQKMLKTFG